MSSLPNMSMIARCGSWDGGSGMGGFKRQAPFIIGVAGGTASGKTTVYASPLHIIALQPPSPRGPSISDSDRDFIQFKKKQFYLQVRDDHHIAEGSASGHYLSGTSYPQPSFFSIYPFICKY